MFPCLLPLFSFAKGNIHKTYYGKEFHSPGEEEPGDQGKTINSRVNSLLVLPCLSPLLKETSIRPTMEKGFIHQEKRNQGPRKRINSRVNSLLVLPCLLPLFSLAKGNTHKTYYGKGFHSPGEEELGDQGKDLTPELILCWCFRAFCLSSPLLKETSIEKQGKGNKKPNPRKRVNSRVNSFLVCLCAQRC